MLNRPILLDGALGTELERHGVETSGPSWTARANLTHPDLIRQIHSDYLLRGADVITTNTFRTNPRAVAQLSESQLASARYALNGESLTKAAIRLAIEARDATCSTALVAASISPVEDCFSPELAPLDVEGLFAEHRRMCDWTLAAGADIILIETMSTLREARAALQAARAAGASTVWVSLVPRDADTLLDGSRIGDAVAALAAEGADLVALNCAPVSTVRSARPRFVEAARAAEIPFGCYPNASERMADGSWDLQASSDEMIAIEAKCWLRAGAVMIGSCCGTTPLTTATLAGATSESGENWLEVTSDRSNP